MKIERSKWSVALNALPKDMVLDLARDLSIDLEPEPVTLPKSGLQLLTLRDGVNGEPYYLGEVPIASACVSLKTKQGDRVEGGAIIQDEDEELVTALAILDGVMAHQLEGRKEVERLIIKGSHELQKRDEQRAQLLARTKVDFSLVSEE